MGALFNRWSLTLLSDGLDTHSWSDYEVEGVGFEICQNLKMTPYSQMKPICHLKPFYFFFQGQDI